MVMGSSQIWAPWIIDDIHSKAQLGRYRIRGLSTFQRVTHFDDLTFLSTGLTRFPLEGYKERCNTRTVIGALHAESPLDLATPIYITGMSYGALSANAKIALGKASTWSAPRAARAMAACYKGRGTPPKSSSTRCFPAAMGSTRTT